MYDIQVKKDIRFRKKVFKSNGVVTIYIKYQNVVAMGKELYLEKLVNAILNHGNIE